MREGSLRPCCIILTALRVEYEAVCAHLSDLYELEGTVYQFGNFLAAKGQMWEVGVVEIGAGGAGAALETERAIIRFQPRLVFFVGVAGGLKDVVRGDVVAATKVYAYESGKAATTLEARPTVWNATYELVQRARAEARKPDWLRRLNTLCPDPAPRVFVAPLAAGEKVLASTRSDIYTFLQANYNDAVAVEMEGHGFLKAVHDHHDVKALIIRGVSDCIDDKPEADAAGSQELAARYASAFAFEVLAKLDAADFSPRREQAVSSVNLLSRERFLKRVRAKVTDALGQSLPHIALTLQEQPNAVANPWQAVMPEIQRPSRVLPSGTTIRQVYNNADGQLLLLGEPGAGKTTLLLKLGLDLLALAEQNKNHPMPAIFNLSSWVRERQPLAEWLIEELRSKYQVPRNIGRSWIDSDQRDQQPQILPLLDGLDEVTPDARSACVGAINTYLEHYYLASAVVCSRSTAYLAQTERISLQTAVEVQPLTVQQVDDYLASAIRLEPVREALQRDQELRELATTPLMLSVLALVYQGRLVETSQMSTDSQERHPQNRLRRDVFATYIEHMLNRRSKQAHYTPKQTKHWLAWLAKVMIQQNQTEFYIEQMQPDWLNDHQSKHLYQRGDLVLRGTLIGGIVGLLTSSSIFSTSVPCFIGTFLFALAGTILAKQKGATASAEQVSYGSYVLSGILLGLGGVLSARVSYGRWDVGHVTSEGLNFALGGLLIRILLARSFQRHILIKGGSWWNSTLWQRLSSLGSVLSRTQFTRRLSGWGSIFWQRLLSRNFLQQSRLMRHISRFWRAIRQRHLSREHIKNGIMIGLSITVVAMLHEVLKGQSKTPRIIVGEGIRYGLILGFAGIFLSDLLEGLWHGRQQIGSGSRKNNESNREKSDAQAHNTSQQESLGENDHSHESHYRQKIQFTDVVVWSWQRCKRHLLDLNHVALGFLLALSVGLTVRLSYEIRGDVPGPFYGVSVAGLIFLNYWVLLGFFRGMARKQLSKQHRVRPNQGFWRSARNSGVIGGVSALIGWLSYSLTVLLRVGPAGWLPEVRGIGLSFSLAVGLLSGLLIGGLACLQYLTLHWLLWRRGFLPWNYPRFLDHTTERSLLRKVGGGYIFLHRLLLDYFASLDTALPPHDLSASADESHNERR